MMSYCFMVKKGPTHNQDKYLLILSKNDSGNTVKKKVFASPSKTTTQGYRNRYNLIERPSGSSNFYEINKGL